MREFNFARDVIERHWARKRPEGTALWWADPGAGRETKLTFGELAAQARKAAWFFKRVEVRRGDRVLVMLPRVTEWWIAMLGLIRQGAVPIPCTSLLTARDLAYRARMADARAVLTDAEGAAKAGDFSGRKILVGPGGGGWEDFAAGVAGGRADYDPPRTAADEPGILYFTSGTTGMPKMVLHTQASYGLGHRTTGKLWLDLGPGDVIWNLSDTGWAKAAWSSLFGPWLAGACIFAAATRGKFQAAAALDTLARYPITTWCAAPTALRMMVREDLGQWRSKFPHLRHCVSAGEPLNPEALTAWRAATGLTIYEGYGQTETVLLTGHFRGLGQTPRPGSMGRAAPGFDLGVLGPDLREVATDCEGELAVRVRPRPLGLFREYWKNPEENAARFRGDWYLTGDVVRRDREGYFWFVGRGDDVIKSAGYRIGPFEVESALVEHPAVVEAAVVGRPDGLRGQIVKAFVVLRKQVAASEALKSELQEHCKQVTAPYKYPREIEFLAELPKTVSGKIRRNELRGRGRG